MAGWYIDPTSSMTYFLDPSGVEYNLSNPGTLDPLTVDAQNWADNGFYGALGQTAPQNADANPQQRAYTPGGQSRQILIRAPNGQVMTYMDWINAGMPGTGAAAAAPAATPPGTPPLATPPQPPGVGNTYDAGAPGVQPAPQVAMDPNVLKGALPQAPNALDFQATIAQILKQLQSGAPALKLPTVNGL